MDTLEEGRKYYLDYCKDIFVFCLGFGLYLWCVYLAISSTHNYHEDVILRRTYQISSLKMCRMIPILLFTCAIPLAFSFVYGKR